MFSHLSKLLSIKCLCPLNQNSAAGIHLSGSSGLLKGSLVSFWKKGLIILVNILYFYRKTNSNLISPLPRGKDMQNSFFLIYNFLKIFLVCKWATSSASLYYFSLTLFPFQCPFLVASGICGWYRRLHQHNVGWQAEPPSPDGSDADNCNPCCQCLRGCGWYIRDEHKNWSFQWG